MAPTIPTPLSTTSLFPKLPVALDLADADEDEDAAALVVDALLEAEEEAVPFVVEDVPLQEAAAGWEDSVSPDSMRDVEQQDGKNLPELPPRECR